LTNHQSGSYEEDGKTYKWNYFVKIIAVPSDAHMGVAADGEDPTKWYEADGTEIGAAIWGSFTIIQEVESGEGPTYLSPAGPGFGKYAP